MGWEKASYFLSGDFQAQAGYSVLPDFELSIAIRQMLQEIKGGITEGWRTPQRGEIPFGSIIADNSFYLIVESMKEEFDLT